MGTILGLIYGAGAVTLHLAFRKVLTPRTRVEHIMDVMIALLWPLLAVGFGALFVFGLLCAIVFAAVSLTAMWWEARR